MSSRLFDKALSPDGGRRDREAVRRFKAVRRPACHVMLPGIDGPRAAEGFRAYLLSILKDTRPRRRRCGQNEGELWQFRCERRLLIFRPLHAVCVL